MTPHCDLKQQENNNGVLGAGLAGGGGGGGGHKHFCHISVGVKYVFPTGLGGSSKFLPTTQKCNRPPHLVINDSSLREQI